MSDRTKLIADLAQEIIDPTEEGDRLRTAVDAAVFAIGRVQHGEDCTYLTPRHKTQLYGQCTCGLWALVDAVKPWNLSSASEGTE